jgi:hypothetical protein
MRRVVLESGKDSVVQFFRQWPSGMRHVLNITAAAAEGSQTLIDS